MRRAALASALLFVLVSAGSGDVNSWQIKAGIADGYPWGGDLSTRFGVDPGGTWDYDGRDAVHPPVGDPYHDSAFICQEDYWQIYVDRGYGWPPPWGRHGNGALPNYPHPGLLKDTRAPIPVNAKEPEYWLVRLQAPNEGDTFFFNWSVNTELGFEVPNGMYVKIWGNPDLEAVGIRGDLDLLALGPGEHVIYNIPQFGRYENGDPIPHYWVIEARMVPEPGCVGMVMGGLMGLGAAVRRRKGAGR